MNLKESYRYANYLDRLLDIACGYLCSESFVTTVKQNHLRSKANPDAEDEMIEVPKYYDEDFTANDIMNFSVKVLTEKEALSDAIATAKTNTDINIDNAVALNRKRQKFISALKDIVDLKPGEKTISGKAYKFDVNGEQRPYIYDIVEVKSIDFDRNDVKALIKKYSKICDEVSARLDAIEINTEVSFEPLWDVSDSFEDIVTAK